MAETTLKKTENETLEEKRSRLFLLAMESLEKYAAASGFNLKDCVGTEVIKHWHDSKLTVKMIRNKEASDKRLRAERQLIDEKVREAIKSKLTPGELATWKMAHE